jgi:hypothetical protein
MTKLALSPGKRSHHTAKWARTMTKWLISYRRRKGARWNVVDFGGRTGSEARGIVDLMAVRKDHRSDGRAFRRGDRFEIILIQTKGGSARCPTPEDRARLLRVAKHHRAESVVFASWRRGARPDLFQLEGVEWRPVSPHDVFG